MKMIKRIWNAIFYKEPPIDMRYKYSVALTKQAPAIETISEYNYLNPLALKISFIDFIADSEEDLWYLLNDEERMKHIKGQLESSIKRRQEYIDSYCMTINEYTKKYFDKEQTTNE